MKNKRLIIILVAFIVLFAFSFMVLDNITIVDYATDSVSSLNNSISKNENNTNNSDSVEEENSVKEDSENNDETSKIKALDYTFTTYDGREVSISDYEGSYVVLNFFATWCKPCMVEMEHFSAAQEVYRDKNVTFLMVNVQYPSGDTMEDLDNFINTTDYNFDNVLLDSGAEYFSSYGLSSFPTTLFIDTENYIRTAYMSSLDKEVLDLIINDLLDME